MPVPVAMAAQRAMPDGPSLWNLYDGLHDFAGHGWRIMQLYGEHRGYVTLLLARGSWTILSASESLPVFNEVLDPLAPADLHDRDKIENYLWHIVLLQRHGRGNFLDKEFRRENVDTSRYVLWTDGTKAQRRKLRALCRDSIMTQSGQGLTICLNLITMRGAVERWTFHLRMAKAVQFESAEIIQVCKERTFFYPLM